MYHNQFSFDEYRLHYYVNYLDHYGYYCHIHSLWYITGCWSGCRNCMQLSEEVSTCLSCEEGMVLADTVVNDVSVQQCLRK